LRGPDGCRCWPGDEVDGETVQAVFTGADGVEVSAVNVPAVPEARGVEIRAQLSAWAGEGPSADAAQKGRSMKSIATQLGLATAASEDDILAAVARLKDERDALAVKLGAEQERGAAVAANLAALEVERNVARAAATAAHVESRLREMKACGALAVARDAAGEATMSNGEKMLRAAATRGGIAAFDEAAADFKPGTFAPSGALPQLTVTPPPAADAKHPLLADPEVRRRLAATGVTEEQVLKYNGLGMYAEGGR
jgi:hypothetical protein